MPGGGDCFACHGAVGLQKELPNGRIVSLHINKEPFERSPHAAVGCAACHGGSPHVDGINSAAKWQSFVYELADVCQGCHPDEWEQFRGSIHVASGKAQAPDRCTRCHDPHEPNKLPDSKSARVARCGECHKAEAETYLRSINGQNLKLGSKRVADCTDCHGMHDVVGISTRSGLTPKRVAHVCSKCHGSVGPKQVAGWYSHRPRTRVQSSILSVVKGFYIIMIPFLILSMIAHNAASHLREMRRRAEERHDS